MIHKDFTALAAEAMIDFCARSKDGFGNNTDPQNPRAIAVQLQAQNEAMEWETVRRVIDAEGELIDLPRGPDQLLLVNMTRFMEVGGLIKVSFIGLYGGSKYRMSYSIQDASAMHIILNYSMTKTTNIGN